MQAIQFAYLNLPNGIILEDGGGNAVVRNGVITVYLETFPLIFQAANNWRTEIGDISDHNYFYNVYFDGEFTVTTKESENENV